jgi:hypothetical protein
MKTINIGPDQRATLSISSTPEGPRVFLGVQFGKEGEEAWKDSNEAAFTVEFEKWQDLRNLARELNGLANILQEAQYKKST